MKFRLSKRIAPFLVLVAIAHCLYSFVPPHPRVENPPTQLRTKQVEKLSLGDKSRIIPNDILVLRVQFSDLAFNQIATYPDSLVHDTAFFERWMYHLRDFFDDASHSRYDLRYYVYPNVFVLPRPMAFYGIDTATAIDANSLEIISDLVSLADPVIDFSQYGGLVIFHAGAGQESDISGLRPEQLWSTFITRKDLQNYFDEDNDGYGGYPTSDGTLLKNIVLVPEYEFQDYFPAHGEQNAESYLFSIFGVLAHQFGHLLGLPTLFDNVSSNGRSQGIGNWGLMGTGLWNGNGYVPAQVSPWCRMYLGWEEAITVSQDSQDLAVDYFLDHNPNANRLYKLPISSTEYFLVENRQQNPDGSLNPYNSQPSYSFKLLPEGEQEYYDNLPELPYFNFMTNSYLGSEWDFFLPGLGGPIPGGYSSPVDGSGLMIWHIDENIIEANFDPSFESNRPNADASHKGIDIEEADGTQHLDTAVFDIYKYGSPYDSFRQGNNDYFGNPINNGLLSLPSAESYYGGVSVEVYNISSSANVMTFSVKFVNGLNADYNAECTLPAASIDYDGNGIEELFYPIPDGKLVMWKDNELMPDFPIYHDPLDQLYVWDENKLWLPTQRGHIARLHTLSGGSLSLFKNFIGYSWASHPVDVAAGLFHGHMAGSLALPMFQNESASTLLVIDKSNADGQISIALEGMLYANLIATPTEIYALTKSAVQGYVLNRIAPIGNYRYSLDVPTDSTIVAISMAPMIPNLETNDIIVQTPQAIYMYGWNQGSSSWTRRDGFPAVLSIKSTAAHTLGDFDRNSLLDIVIGGENGCAILDYKGQLLNSNELELSMPDSLGTSSGALAFDLDGDGKAEIVGNFSRNRIAVWDDNFKLKKGYPVSYPYRSRFLPLFQPIDDNKGTVYSATDNGRIYSQEISGLRSEHIDRGWFTEYANYRRTAYRGRPDWDNQYQSNSTFVPSEVYIFPNPLKSIYDQKLSLNVMTTKDTEIELSIFDISGSLVYRKNSFAKAYLRNRDILDLPSQKLSSGVYIAVVKAPTETKRIKFAVEK